MPSPRQHAVVFSGNGYNAAYEVGVLKALLRGEVKALGSEPVRPSIYAGTSVGAYNAAFMVAQSSLGDLAAVERLEQSWTTGVGPRFRGSPFDYLDPRFYLPDPVTPLLDLGRDALHVSRDLARRTGDFLASARPGNLLTAAQDQILGYDWDILADIEPMERLIRGNIAFEGIRRSDKELRITATSWREGDTRVFENHDFTDEAGCRIITAAMAIPGAVPRQRVDLDELVDGAMLMKRPLQPVIDAHDGDAATRLTLHVVYLDPEFGEAPLIGVRGSFAVVYRLFMLAFSRSVNAEVERLQTTNRGLRFLELLRELDPDSEVMRLWTRLNQEIRDAVEVDVHRYRAYKHIADLRDLFVRMTDEKLRSLVDAGYRDTLSHDCEEAGCVLASKA